MSIHSITLLRKNMDTAGSAHRNVSTPVGPLRLVFCVCAFPLEWFQDGSRFLLIHADMFDSPQTNMDFEAEGFFLLRPFGRVSFT